MSERARVRGLRFSDSDWERIIERARAAQMSIQEYVRWQLLERPGAARAWEAIAAEVDAWLEREERYG